ncbi:(deoxy)nucleoside triphosphate pyrophosphohydrolase [Bacteroidota bacterium]
MNKNYHLSESNYIRVVASVIKRDDKFLVCQRALNMRYGGLWEFPGGKINNNETHIDAIKRELKEELDLAVTEVGDKLYEKKDENSSFIIEFYEVSITGQPNKLEHHDIGWFNLSELLNINLAPSDKKFVNKYLKYNRDGLCL